jgi:hypothetical protein
MLLSTMQGAWGKYGAVGTWLEAEFFFVFECPLNRPGNIEVKNLVLCRRAICSRMMYYFYE